jgi:hypothetical protein
MVLAEKKRREAESCAKSQASAERFTGQSDGRQTGSAGGREQSPRRLSLQPRVSAKPNSWHRPIPAIPGNLPMVPRAPHTAQNRVRAFACTGKGEPLRHMPGG